MEAKARECIGFLFVCTFAKCDCKLEHEMQTSYKKLQEIWKLQKFIIVLWCQRIKGNAEERPRTYGTECGQPLGGLRKRPPFLLNIKTYNYGKVDYKNGTSSR